MEKMNGIYNFLNKTFSVSISRKLKIGKKRNYKNKSCPIKKMLRKKQKEWIMRLQYNF